MKIGDKEQGWKVKMTDNVELERKDLRIHPDMNDEGTAGCVGLRCDAATLRTVGNFFENYYAQGCTAKITINIPNNPNYSNVGKTNLKSTGQ